MNFNVLIYNCRYCRTSTARPPAASAFDAVTCSAAPTPATNAGNEGMRLKLENMRMNVAPSLWAGPSNEQAGQEQRLSLCLCSNAGCTQLNYKVLA